MKLLVLVVLLSAGLPGWHWLVRVREHNAAQAQAQAAAERGRAAEAVYYYQQAVALAGRGGPAPALLLNLAQAQAQAGQLPAARATYTRLLGPAVPPVVGSLARQQLAVLAASQQQIAQAVGLLKQALLLNPTNTTARYNYELLSQYLAGQRPGSPPPPAASTNAAKQPATKPPKSQPDSTQQTDQGRAPSPGEQAGTDRAGQAPSLSAPPDPAAPPTRPQPGPQGQPDATQPLPSAGGAARGRQPGSGRAQPLPSGTQPGSQRGLDASAAASGRAAPTGQSRRPGTAAATNADLQLQTQRERLKAMSLTPAQAQQLLDALRASEQQYLQQRPRARQGTPPPPGTPMW